MRTVRAGDSWLMPNALNSDESSTGGLTHALERGMTRGFSLMAVSLVPCAVVLTSCKDLTTSRTDPALSCTVNVAVDGGLQGEWNDELRIAEIHGYQVAGFAANYKGQARTTGSRLEASRMIPGPSGGGLYIVDPAKPWSTAPAAPGPAR